MSLSQSNLEPPRFAYEPGDVIAGKYALEDLLGSGGMGAVFRARNTVIDMPVAIKLIRADLDRALFSGRLLQEARAAAELAHPAIVRVFDVGQTALGDPFIVMELLEGETLSSIIEREGRLTSVRAAQLLLPIADALSVAHAKGFIHRDVKPDNVFIASGAEGQLQPKLVDFGIVKQEERGGVSQQTQTGSVVGSPDYMSPEQARGLQSVDQRSDVWSFSVVLYESICGRAPFEADNYNALLRQIVETEPPTLRELSAADATLSAIVAKGLSKDTEQRWASLGQMGKALASWLYEQGIGEDVCGASLEARWLSRTTDGAALGRGFRSSIPDGWPEPPSGIRAVGGKLGFAPTIQVTKSAGTPHALSQTSAVPGAATRRKRLVLVGGFVALGFGLGFGAFALGRERPGVAENPRAAGAVSAPEARPEPGLLTGAAAPALAPEPTVAATAPGPTLELDPSRAEPFGKGGASAAGLQPATKRPGAARRAPVAPTESKPASDLLAPY